jgi:formate hydrogenlyase transcriptional activator
MSEELVAEIRALQGCINDLTTLVALPAIWRGCTPAWIVGSLLDVLVEMLSLDFAYARVEGLVPTAITAVRLARHVAPPRSADEVGPLLEAAAAGASSGQVIANPLGDGEVTLAHCWFGLDPEHGVVVAGSRRPGPLTRAETSLLRVAVNQAVVELQGVEVAAARQRAEESERSRTQLQAENLYLRGEQDAEQHWDEIVGRSGALRAVLGLVERVAPTAACVLIQGETGTGKELIARALHRLSGRSERAFVKLNCAAIPTGLLESELFGHEKGAFTGAVSRKLGRFELADQGTMFLDEVGEIPLELQAKLLRVLQEREFERLGGTRTLRVEVRLLAASNRDLEQLVKDGQFRSDLYYRLKVFPIRVPSLRERAEDIPLLVRCFTERHARRCNKVISEIPVATMAALQEYPWPGNVRELENFIERSVILSPGSTLEAPLFELTATTLGEATTLRSIEREHILRALTDANWVIGGSAGAASRLGIKRTSLQHKMAKLGITRPRR